mgnify:CR=1 FL=1
MSKISQELKVLFYLNQRHNRTKWVTIKEIANYLEVSDRQARRYLEDLNSILEIDIETKLGRYGGYRLRTPLDKGFAMPENIVLAMSIAMRSNERIEKVLSELPNYVITDSIVGDNYIDNDVLDNLEQIIKAIQVQKVISFMYRDFDNPLKVAPYKIVLTNHTYYLFGTYNDELRKYDVRFMRDIKQLEAFMPKDNIEQTILKKSSMYGIKDAKETTLRVKCNDQETLLTFDKYFEGKGTKDEEELTYTVTSSSENELYYPLFRISTKKYTFLDKDFIERYLKYLNNQIISIKRGNS